MSIESVGNVKYDFLDNNKNSLCVIFPPAGGIDSRDNFVNLLSQEFNVMDIKEGYFGLSRVNQQDNPEKLKLGNASCSIAEKLSEKNFDKLLIIAGSVGALHALELKKQLNKQNNYLVLFTPAFYNESVLTPVYRKLLGSALKKDGIIEDGWFVKAMEGVHLGKLLKEMQGVAKITGEKSYLLCLKEIMEYPKDEEGIKRLVKDALIVLGKKDSIFKTLCNKDICKAGRIVYIDSGHSPMKEKPKESYELVKDFIERMK